MRFRTPPGGRRFLSPTYGNLVRARFRQSIAQEILRLMSLLNFYYFPISQGTWTHFCPKLRNYPSPGRIFGHLELFHDTVRACLDCTRRVGARARRHIEFIPTGPDDFGEREKREKKVFAATLERAEPRQDYAGQKLTAAALT